MYSFTGNKINTIKENGSFGILIEVGAGMPVYNELCKHPNTASKIVYYAQSPNNWEYNNKRYNHNGVRAVSPEVCQNFIISHNDPANTNFILTNTVQIANDKNVVSHGWFGYKNKDVTYYYHYTINHHQSRKTQLDVIAKIGLDIIAANGDLSKLTNGYIDIILDINLKQLPEAIINCFINSKLSRHQYHNTTVVFNKDGKVERINDFLRRANDLIVFKGSFNPVHKDHISLIEICSSKYENTTPVFCISIENRDKSKTVSPRNLYKRIQLLNQLGYDVIVDTKGLYHYSYTTLIQNVDFKERNLYYVLGGDIVKRFLMDEEVYEKPNSTSITAFNTKWNSCTFLWFNRADIKVKIDSRLNNLVYMDKQATSTSSTYLRELIEAKDIDELIRLGYTHELYHTFLED